MAAKFEIYGHDGPGPNPPKVAIVLEELKLPYKVTKIPFGPEGVKSEKYLKLCPNGRVPTLIDNSTEGKPVTVWESGAILYYLAEQYGQQLLGNNAIERAEVMQVTCLQLASVGPAMGQCNWFKHYYKNNDGKGEDAPQNVVDRYRNEANRLFGVLETILKTQKERGSEFIALDRFTIADAALIPWIRPFMAGFGDLQSFIDEKPLLKAYISRIEARPAVKAAFDKC